MSLIAIAPLLLLASPPPDAKLAGIACRSVHLAYHAMPRHAQGHVYLFVGYPSTRSCRPRPLQGD